MAINYGSYATPRLDLGDAMLEYMLSPSEFIGAQLYPIFESPKKKATYSKLTREKYLQPGDVKRAPRSAYNRDNLEGEDASFECEEYGKEALLDHSDREFYASDFDAERHTAELAMWHVMLAHEIRVAAKVLNTTTFTTGNGRRTDVATAWSDAAADIIGDVVAAKEKVRARIGRDPNTLSVGKGALPFFIKNTAIRNSLQYTQLPTVSALLSALAALFGLERVIVGGAVQNTAKEGQDATLSDVWSNSWAVVAYTCGQGAPLREHCLGRSVLWVADSPDSVMVEEYEEPQTRSTVFRSRQHVDEHEVDPDCEQLLDIAG